MQCDDDGWLVVRLGCVVMIMSLWCVCGMWSCRWVFSALVICSGNGRFVVRLWYVVMVVCLWCLCGMW